MSSLVAGIGLAVAKEFMPDLATRMFGQKGGDIATRVGQAALEATGMSPQSDPNSVVQTLKSDPVALSNYMQTVSNNMTSLAIQEIGAGVESQRIQSAESVHAMQSEDKFTRWSRPIHLWVTAACNLALILGGFLSLIYRTQSLGEYIQFTTAMMPILTASNVVGGAYVFQRSRDKENEILGPEGTAIKVLAKHAPTEIPQTIKDRIARKIGV